MLRELNGHQQDVTGCMFLNQPGGAGEGKGEEDLPSTIVSVSKDMTLRTWNAASGESCQVHSEGQSGQFTHLAAAAPGSTATCYVTSIENGVFVYDVKGAEAVPTLLARTAPPADEYSAVNYPG